MKVGYVQFSPRFGEIKQNVSNVGRLLDDVTADLIVLPELFNSGYHITSRDELPALAEKIPDGFTCRSLEKIAAMWRIHIVAGMLEEDEGRYYIFGRLIGENGYIDHYRKIHLFADQKIYFTPGDRPFRVYDIGDARIGIMICFDWVFPESMRIFSLMGADIICHPSNLVMPYCPKAMLTRCLENRVFAVTSNRTGKDVKEKSSLSFIGQSQIVAPDGSIIKKAGADNETVDVVLWIPNRHVIKK